MNILNYVIMKNIVLNKEGSLEMSSCTKMLVGLLCQLDRKNASCGVIYEWSKSKTQKERKNDLTLIDLCFEDQFRCQSTHRFRIIKRDDNFQITFEASIIFEATSESWLNHATITK